ncbi:MAG: hypothetical protein Q8S73_40375 [Deltaproteobacteria bacterium]|nr:hypothetical protein [Deltaproteobacteria bacterium]
MALDGPAALVRIDCGMSPGVGDSLGSLLRVRLDAGREIAEALLLDVSKVLGTSLDLTRTLNDVARLVVPHLADWCAIDLLSERGTLERAAVAHVDPAKVALAWDLWRRLPPGPDDPHRTYAVLRARRGERFEEIPDALLAASIPDPDLLALARSLGLRSSMCVPLVARPRARGAHARLGRVGAALRRGRHGLRRGVRAPHRRRRR